MTSFGARTLGALLAVGVCCLGCDDDAQAPVQTPPVESTPDAAPAGTPDELVMPGRPTLGCRDASDCTGGDCVPITDGYSACSDLDAELETRADAGLIEGCDGDHPCETGTCFRLGVAAGANQCTPGGVDLRNVCISDECSTDADCPSGGFCAPAGVAGTSKLYNFPRRRCLAASCNSNADCRAKPGGICGLIRQGCMPYGIEQWGFRDATLACIYPDGCTLGSDCTSGYCDVLDGAAVCLSGLPGSSR